MMGTGNADTCLRTYNLKKRPWTARRAGQATGGLKMSGLNAKRYGHALLALVVLGIAAPVAAQGLAGPPIQFKGVTSMDRAAAGSKLEAAVVMEIPAPYHVNAHKPNEEWLVATDLKLKPSPGLTFGPVNYPAPLSKSFSFSKKPLLVYEERLVMRVPVTVAASAKPGNVTIQAEVQYQACDDKQCFIPRTRPVTIPVTIAPKGTSGKPVNQEIFSAPSSGQTPPPAAAGTTTPLSQNSTGDALADKLLRLNPLLALGLLFLLGLALNATPCVWPIIPITVSFFGSQSGGKRSQTFMLAVFYVLGMALMYSSLGLIAALSGKSFGFAFQNPWVVGAISLFFVAMALSMFGLFELRPPAFIANRAQAKRGPMGAMSMGLIVGVVSAPCTGPVVTALLTAIAAMASRMSTPQAAAGGFAAFFTLALGLGTPYLLLGWFTGASRALPRTGPWTEIVKRVFGLVMLGAALYFASSLMPRGVFRVLFPAYFLAAGIYLLFAEPELAATKGIKGFKALAGLATALFGVWSLVGVGLRTENAALVQWASYSPSVLESARAAGKPAIIDFTAEWCAACHELDEYTFSDPKVTARLNSFAAMKADMTREDDPQVVALSKQYDVKGLPTVIFLGPDGQERRDLRVTGFVPAEKFLQLMDRAASGAAVASR
jgi:thioredoxin:protein disulfide reductase